jgi:hypothetical protein
MTRILGALPAALIAARNGLSANAFYKELQQLGMGARRSEVLQLYKVAANIVARSGDEVFRDITRAPAPHETVDWPTRKATGIRQNVTLVYRDNITGTIKVTRFSTKNESPVTRENAMAQAINAYADHAERYGQTLIGAVHTGTFNFVPYDQMP